MEKEMGLRGLKALDAQRWTLLNEIRPEMLDPGVYSAFCYGKKLILVVAEYDVHIFDNRTLELLNTVCITEIDDDFYNVKELSRLEPNKTPLVVTKRFTPKHKIVPHKQECARCGEIEIHSRNSRSKTGYQAICNECLYHGRPSKNDLEMIADNLAKAVVKQHKKTNKKTTTKAPKTTRPYKRNTKTKRTTKR